MMSYFPCDIPFMSDKELEENGISIPKDATDKNTRKVEYVSRQYLLDEYDRQHQGPPGGARKIIAEAPAEDVVPVVHGRWMPQKGGGLCCSECGGYALDESGGNFIHVSVPSKFCPHCGAKMDIRGEV